jgi:L-gulonate 3-dehydrogenase
MTSQIDLMQCCGVNGESMSKVGIVGAGLIGCSWANVFARAGWTVQVWDSNPQQCESAKDKIAASLHELAAHGLVQDADTATANIRVVSTLEEAVSGVDYVQESGPERLDLKIELFRRMDAAVAPATILASSTSAIVPSLFTEELAGRARCLVAHPVNPPHLAPVVEVCGAPWTDPTVRSRTRAILTEIGQSPVDVKREVDGFILNRLQAALLTEAFRLVEEGYVSPQDLDRTIADGLGLRWAFMGPFETIELNAPGGIADYCQRFVPWFRRYAADPAPLRVWDDDQWRQADAAWGQTPSAEQIAEKSRWRNERMAALLAHKRAQKNF